MRGSRRQILDWTNQDRPIFARELTETVGLEGLVVSDSDWWMPQGHRSPEEAKLTRCTVPGLNRVKNVFTGWWVAHPPLANEPNWDMLATCKIWDHDAFLFVEAKSYGDELDWNPKRQPRPSPESRENHERIGKAIDEAGHALTQIVGEPVNLSRDKCYQLSNRVAWAWKLASTGSPTVLAYVGFLQDWSITDLGCPFRDHADWLGAMKRYMRGIVPDCLIERRLDCGLAPMWFLIRSRKARSAISNPNRTRT
jgi:hypothetical protein